MAVRYLVEMPRLIHQLAFEMDYCADGFVAASEMWIWIQMSGTFWAWKRAYRGMEIRNNVWRHQMNLKKVEFLLKSESWVTVIARDLRMTTRTGIEHLDRILIRLNILEGRLYFQNSLRILLFGKEKGKNDSHKFLFSIISTSNEISEDDSRFWGSQWSSFLSGFS